MRSLKALIFAALLLALTACSSSSTIGKAGLPPQNAVLSRAYGIWTPSATDTCPKSLHDQYWVYGSDGKVYPTWHPATDIDPSTGLECTYGHEHGRNPAGSSLAAWTMPFGYVNEQLSPQDPAYQRNEDHVGHKIEWENNINLTALENNKNTISITCDVLTKLHQGTHSADATHNNLHEFFFAIRCS